VQLVEGVTVDSLDIILQQAGAVDVTVPIRELCDSISDDLNYSPETVTNAITAALFGEYDPLRDVGWFNPPITTAAVGQEMERAGVDQVRAVANLLLV
jgi:hypothetical protein